MKPTGSVICSRPGDSSWSTIASTTVATANAGQRHAPSSRQRRRRVQKRSSAGTGRA
jgi:hypothetical protein